MYRWMICPIIGNGTDNNPYRTSVNNVQGVNIAENIVSDISGTPQTNPNWGKPKYQFAMCLVATPSINAISAVSNSYVFPDYNLDGRMDGMEGDARTGLVQSVEAYNFDGNGFHVVADHDDGDSYRSILEAIGKQLDPAFTVNGFSVAEVAG